MNRLLYAIHKWISAIAFVQLAVWTVTGFLFTVISQDSLKSAPVDGAHEAALVAPAIPAPRAMEIGASSVGAPERLELYALPSGVYYVVKGASASVRLDARTGEVAPVTREEAEATARRDQPGSPKVREAALIHEAGLEYRDCGYVACALPAWRVALADAEGTAIYVDAVTGEVTARRNERWRTYDFLWSLHIMDYKGREDFNHTLIRAAAILALFTVISGVVLLGLRAAGWVRRRRAARG